MLIIPSRGRPQLIKRFAESYIQTQAECRVLLLLDNDDPKIREYFEVVAQTIPWQWTVITGPRKKCPEACQFAFEKYPDEPWYALFGDDVVPLTMHWDQKLIEAAGSRKVSYCNDKTSWPRALHPFVGGDMVRAVGYYAMPGVLHWYMDTLWEWLAMKTGRLVALEDVFIQHHHVQFEDKTDQTNDERWLDLKTGIMHSPEFDQKIWKDWIDSGEGEKAIQRILEKCPL